MRNRVRTPSANRRTIILRMTAASYVPSRKPMFLNQ
jgi:hypothetical protein